MNATRDEEKMLRVSFRPLPESTRKWLIRYALGGAVLMDLALENRIDTDVDRLFLIGSAPVGDALLDPMLAEIAGSSESHDALFWVEHATRHADDIRETALLRLFDNGILVVHDDRYLRIFGTQRYMLVRKETERELTGRIKAVLLNSAIPDPRDVASLRSRTIAASWEKCCRQTK